MTLQLGLIGDNIARSRAPLLHRLAGAQTGMDVRYDRLVPASLGQDFEGVFARCAEAGFRGINVTYPYKERVVRHLRIDDPLVRAIGAVNTVVFDADGAVGYNTDHSGFAEAYRAARDAPPGPTLMIGTGGVGRAIAFALAALGAEELRLVDRVPEKAEALAAALNLAAPEMRVRVGTSPESAAAGVSGLVNCTPVGMDGLDGIPIAASAMAGAEWAFDAVYTPPDTAFLGAATALGLVAISGYELFFWQGVHAWAHFSGAPLDRERLRADLAAAPAEEDA